MIKPRKLKLGDTIGVIPCSSSSRRCELESGVAKLKQLGFAVRISEHCNEKYTYGYLAATDDQRADDINKMLADPEIDALICQRGGYGAHRIVDKINWKLLHDNPRLFIGYSDVTLLHLAISGQCNMVSLLGPMPASDFAKDIDNFTIGLFTEIVTGVKSTGMLPQPAGENVESLISGIAEGEIIGGNLSLLVGSLGTRYDFDTKGKILLIEDIGEEPYRVDRMLSQLRLAGKFDDCAGIVFGDFNDCEAIGKPTLMLRQVIEDLIAPLKKPAIYNFQCGHCMPMISLPLGVKARLDASNCQLELLEPAVV